MSGEAVILQGGAEGHIPALVRAVAKVAGHTGVPVAVVGGLAVTCRLAMAHRATGDVDMVTDDDAELMTSAQSAIAHLMRAGVLDDDPEPESGRVFVGGTKVELIATQPLTPAAADIEPDEQRLYVLAHRWALETATPVRILVEDSDAEATVPVATVSALLGMKLHAFGDRRWDERKKASDAWDLYRLVADYGAGPVLRKQFAAAPGDLRELVLAGIARIFREDVLRTRRLVRSNGDQSWFEAMSDVRLGDLCDELMAALR